MGKREGAVSLIEKENAMKRILVLTICVLMISSVAMADVIGFFSDATGSSCNVTSGFNTTAAIIHKFTTGATGARFKVDFPAGTSFFSFATPYTPVGQLTSDLSLGYGQCLSSSIVLGTIVAILVPGTAHVLTADLQPFILYTNCVFAELPASGGALAIDGPVQQCLPDPVEPSTWGQVKALYR